MIKEKYVALISACSEKDPESMEFIVSSIERIGQYVDRVYEMESLKLLYGKMYEGQELRDKITELDDCRHSAHESAIVAVNGMNRLAVRLGVKPLYEGDPDNRKEIADHCENMVRAFFEDRTNLRK